MAKKTTLALLLLVILPGSSRAAIMTFGDLSGNTGDLLSPYTEGTFLVKPITGRWMEMTTSSPTPGVTGNPGPSIWEDTFTASLEVTELSTGLFTFSSADLWGETADYTIEGLRDGVVIFSTSANVPSDDWLTLVSPSGATIDTLRVSAIRDQAEYSNIDNVNVNVVPEPSTLMICLGGLFLFGLYARRLRERV